MLVQSIFIATIFFISILFFGHFTQCICYKENQGLGYTLLIGFLTLFSLMELFLVPMTFLGLSFHGFFLGFSICLVLLFLGSLLFWKRLLQSLKIFYKSIPTWFSWILLLTLGIIIYQLVMFESHVYLEGDNAFYVNLANDAYFYNELMGRNPETGLEGELILRYALSMWPIFFAYIGKLFSIMPTLVATCVTPYIIIPFIYFFFFLFGRKLFPERKESAAYFITFIVLLHLFLCGDPIRRYAPSFLFTSPWIGKSIVATFFTPACYYFMLRLKDSTKKGDWIVLFLFCLSGCLFSSMNIFLLPLILGGLGFLISIYNRSITFFIRTLLALSPCLLLGIAYIIL